MSDGAPRLLLVAAQSSYNLDDFVVAARAEGAEVLVATDRCHVLDGLYQFPAGSLVCDFYELETSTATLVAAVRAGGVRAVLPVGGEAAALLAAEVASRLGLRANAPAAAAAARDKRRMRELLAAAGVPQPAFELRAVDDGPPPAPGPGVGFPCVIKPLLLSASRGVMRADDPQELAERWARLARLLRTPELAELDAEAGRLVLIESFVPGEEVALEGLLEDGALRVLALYDKPDPLDGPFFEETIYVTPSRHPAAVQQAVAETTARAAAALGLSDGPVHAELRLPPGGGAPSVIEVAARSIGGLCSRMLRFGTGRSLEAVLVRHALGLPVDMVAERERAAAGAMMIPIPAAGVLREARGVDEARALPGVEDVVISIRPGEKLVPLPEGAAYLGFIFARAETPAAVEAALRAAHARLDFEVTPTL